MGNKQAVASATRTVPVGEVTKENKRKYNRIKTSKYTIYGFLFQNLWEQLRRFANICFLLVSIISSFIESPVSPFTTILPLVFVLSVTMVKQGYEDLLRRRSDRAVNNGKVVVIRDLKNQTIRNKYIRPGEIIKIYKDCDVPCDAVLLWTSDTRGKCFVTTANLDGETSLKPLKVPNPLLDTSNDFLKGNNITIECQHPIPDIYTFKGYLKVNDITECALGIENLVLRGSRLKNTEWAMCCAVYTGKDTKLSLNSKITSNKFTSSETYINKFLFFNLTIVILEVLLSYFMKRYLERSFPEHQQYIGPYKADDSFQSFFQDTFSFLVLYFYTIPISLYVTIELHKFLGSLFINWDVDLYDPESDQPAIANSSDLNEELGQIEVLFTDKTGTLTENDMKFQMCSIKGELYIEREDKLYDFNRSWYTGETVESSETNNDIVFFFKVLALCHAVQVEEIKPVTEFNNNGYERIDSHPVYQSMSSDEIAFLKAAANMNVVFFGEESNKMLLKINGNMEKYEKLHTFEFTSSRKRMSVIVKDVDGQIWFLCKGAESAVLPLCNDNNLMAKINQDIEFFANKGLRTLVVAYKKLTESEYTEMHQEILRKNEEAISDENDIEKWRSLETGLTLIGATGVEDKLQENVADTLESLRKAGIKIWVLTGDKVETAINVAQSCGQITNRSKKMFLTEIADSESLQAQLTNCEEDVKSTKNSPLALVMDGKTFDLILGTTYQNTFVNIALKCNAVICCRLSPLQKALIVKLIKNSGDEPITAAIGDGANDISMIQEAHVGFGIYGKEGRQAARCSDFAFKKFRMLQKIILVHGHWFYQRMGTLVQYSFYKNLVFVNVMLFFQIFAFFSSQSIFDSVFLMLYNVLFAFAPILVLSLSEQCHRPDLLLRDPSLYKKQVDNKVLSWSGFIGWNIVGIYHSIVIYFLLYTVWYEDAIINPDGRPAGQWCYGAALCHCVVIVINLKLWLISRYRTHIFIIAVIGSMLAFTLVANLYSVIHLEENFDGDVYWTFIRLESSIMFWLFTLLITITCLVPDCIVLLYKALKKRKYSDIENVNMLEITRF